MNTFSMKGVMFGCHFQKQDDATFRIRRLNISDTFNNRIVVLWILVKPSFDLFSDE